MGAPHRPHCLGKVPPKANVLMITSHYEANPKWLNLTTNGCFECSLLS